MTGAPRIKSQRLIRKGPLVHETYELLSHWRDNETFESNFERAFAHAFKTVAWRREVQTTLRSRFRNGGPPKALTALARAGFPLDEWTHCLSLAIGTIDQAYWDFCCQWLFPEFEAGRFRIRAEDVVPFVKDEWRNGLPDSTPMSAYGVTRTSRDLLRFGHELGILRGGGPVKEFSPAVLTDRVFLFTCYLIVEQERSAARIVRSHYWRLLLMPPSAVEAYLLRLHQFQKLRYEAAGSLVEISLPCRGLKEFAESIAK